LNVFRIAQGALKQTQTISITNSGLGTLSITGATATSTGNWLSADLVPNSTSIAVSADPGSLAAGSYQGTVSIAANAANAPVTIPVQFDVIAAAPPVSFFKGAVNNSAEESPDVLAQGTIVGLYGEQFTLGAPQTTGLPLPTSVAGTTVFVNDQQAPIFYSSYGQINFQIPYNAATGPGVVRVDRSGQRGNNISVTIVPSAPRILLFGKYGIVINQDGSLAIPTAAGGHPAKAGDVLVVYAIGLGQTTPSVTAGTAAPGDPLAMVPSIGKVLFGGGGFAGDPIQVTPSFAGLTPGYAGLYQINVAVPAGLPPGDVPVLLLGSNGVISKIAYIAVQ
jgi:uncharacterized protein (TIGR03437 family)